MPSATTLLSPDVRKQSNNNEQFETIQNEHKKHKYYTISIERKIAKKLGMAKIWQKMESGEIKTYLEMKTTRVLPAYCALQVS